MAEDNNLGQSRFWTIVTRASANVANWEEWKRRYLVDIFYEGYPLAPRERAGSSEVHERHERRIAERRQSVETG